MKPQSQIFEIWTGTFDYGIANTENGMLNVAMHPQVIGRPHNIMMLEKFINHVLESGAWIAPFAEIYKNIKF